MVRWLAPAVGSVGFLVLLVGLLRVHGHAGASGGVALVGWGVVGLVVAALSAGVIEFVDSRRR